MVRRGYAASHGTGVDGGIVRKPRLAALLLTSTMLACFMSGAPGYAQPAAPAASASQIVNFSIPAQPLSAAVNAFIRWLDLHNLLGIVTAFWVLVVGATGVMNELTTPLFGLWQRTDVRAMLAPWQGKAPPKPDELASVQSAYGTALRALPDMNVTAIVYPGGDFGSPHHYLLWGHGKTPLTERLFSPVLVDAQTGDLTAIVQMPWYLRALEISRPLHFGDYGGMPLKIIWALLDLVTIAVLASGLYLWVAKRGRAQAGKESGHVAASASAGLPEAAE